MKANGSENPAHQGYWITIKRKKGSLETCQECVCVCVWVKLKDLQDKGSHTAYEDRTSTLVLE